ncbi:MAG TPA: lipoate-protein ligase B, partial [Caulobacter sp.]|nr:lipoate-protein ligase B [Caulobacter sp.]
MLALPLNPENAGLPTMRRDDAAPAGRAVSTDYVDYPAAVAAMEARAAAIADGTAGE